MQRNNPNINMIDRLKGLIDNMSVDNLFIFKDIVSGEVVGQSRFGASSTCLVPGTYPEAQIKTVRNWLHKYINSLAPNTTTNDGFGSILRRPQDFNQARQERDDMGAHAREQQVNIRLTEDERDKMDYPRPLVYWFNMADMFDCLNRFCPDVEWTDTTNDYTPSLTRSGQPQEVTKVISGKINEFTYVRLELIGHHWEVKFPEKQWNGDNNIKTGGDCGPAAVVVAINKISSLRSPPASPSSTGASSTIVVTPPKNGTRLPDVYFSQLPGQHPTPPHSLQYSQSSPQSSPPSSPPSSPLSSSKVASSPDSPYRVTEEDVYDYHLERIRDDFSVGLTTSTVQQELYSYVELWRERELTATNDEGDIQIPILELRQKKINKDIILGFFRKLSLDGDIYHAAFINFLRNENITLENIAALSDDQIKTATKEVLREKKSTTTKIIAALRRQSEFDDESGSIIIHGLGYRKELTKSTSKRSAEGATAEGMRAKAFAHKLGYAWIDKKNRGLAFAECKSIFKRIQLSDGTMWWDPISMLDYEKKYVSEGGITSMLKAMETVDKEGKKGRKNGGGKKTRRRKKRKKKTIRKRKYFKKTKKRKRRRKKRTRRK